MDAVEQRLVEVEREQWERLGKDPKVEGHFAKDFLFPSMLAAGGPWLEIRRWRNSARGSSPFGSSGSTTLGC